MHYSGEPRGANVFRGKLVDRIRGMDQNPELAMKK
jgi:hypothetical protein